MLISTAVLSIVIDTKSLEEVNIHGQLLFPSALILEDRCRKSLNMGATGDVETHCLKILVSS